MKKSIALWAALLCISLSYAQEKDTLKEGEDLDEIVIRSTRTSRTFRNTPTRVETLDAEELEEKANMKPANVSMVLHESTGIQVQQTSATSGNASIRVQGLDGRYTQLLKDGYANFGNFANGLSILEIPPLDLRQVEIIKGPASTLYGGGAVAGVVNFISKSPEEAGEYSLILNQSHVGQSNLGAFASKKTGKFGYTILGLANLQNDYDVDRDGFSELPESHGFTINPRLFFYPDEKTTFMIGNSFTTGKNTGGDTRVINGFADAEHVYFEKNTTIRNTTTLEYERLNNYGGSFKVKQSISLFDRKIEIPDFEFSGFNANSFTDVSYSFKQQLHTLIAGLSFTADSFRQKQNLSGHDLGNNSQIGGLYLQDTWDISTEWILESGVRFDYARYANTLYNDSGFFALPRISLLYRISPSVSTRIGGGLGYKLPTVFTEQTEMFQYKNVLPLSDINPEKSIGTTFDINYRTKFGEDLAFSANQMFFYTDLSNPLVLQYNGTDFYFVNDAKKVITKGFETNLKFIFKEDFKLFAGYTFSHPTAGYLNGGMLPLVPENKVNLTLVYEKEKNFKFGLEGYFTDSQYLYDATKTPSFWEFGFSAEKYFGRKLSLYINLENFTDERQSRYKGVVNPPKTAPTFDDIWNHTEGFVFSSGIRLRL